jgi:hypothetical protein
MYRTKIILMDPYQKLQILLWIHMDQTTPVSLGVEPQLAQGPQCTVGDTSDF